MVKNAAFKKTKQCCCRRSRVIIFVLIIGIVLIILGIVLRPVVNRIFQDEINDHLVLSPGSPTYKSWKEPNVPIYAKNYLFNILNPEEIRHGKKPFVEQRGPYTYLAHTKKVNITWDNENATVTYDEITWYEYDRELSCKSCDPLNDDVTTVNIPLMVVAEMIKTYPDYFHWKRMVSLLLDSFFESLFITRKVHDLLWGYRDPLLEKITKLREEFPSLKAVIPELNAIVALQPNNTLQGITTIHTGAKDIRLLEMWQSWKGQDKLGIWMTKFANMLNGTDGRQFAPGITKGDKIYFVVTQLCRSLYLTYDHELQDQDIDVYRFVIPQELFLNGTANPNNAAFYPQGFLPTGILDPRKCRAGNVSAPVFISAPHFYLGDPRLVKAVLGLKPNKEKHELSFDVEPHLGVPITNAIRLQVNVFVEPVKDITETSGVPKVYMPVMWFEESATLDSGTTALFRNDILIPMKIFHYVEIALVCLGSFILLMELFIILRTTYKTKRKQMFCCYNDERTPLINDDSRKKERNNNLGEGNA